MNKINIEGFPPKERQWVLDFQQILEKPDPANLPRHEAMIEHVPHSATEDRIYLLEPCVYTLLMYGVPGVEAIYRVAMSNSRGNFDARRALVNVADSKQQEILEIVKVTTGYINDAALHGLVASVKATLATDTAKAIALRQLGDTIRDIVTNPKRRHEIMTFIGELGSKENLVWDLLTKSVLNITYADLQHLQDLVDQDLDERVYQQFLEQHAVILDPVASSIVPRQHLAEVHDTDFVIRRLDDEYTLIEIEKAKDKAFTEYPQPSASLSHGLAQVFQWFTWVEDNIAYAQSHGFPGIHTPKGIVVIGRNADLNAKQRRMLSQMNDLLYPRIRIMTYDDVITSARHVLDNLTRGVS
jgi:hypothetical protein